MEQRIALADGIARASEQLDRLALVTEHDQRLRVGERDVRTLGDIVELGEGSP